MKPLHAWLEREWVGRVLRGLALGLMLIALVTLVVRLARSPGGDGSLSSSHGDENSAALDALVKQVTDRHLFNPPPGKDTISGKLRGILGDKALFGGKWLGVGDTFMDAKILEIGPDWVEYEYEGKTGREWVFVAREQKGEPTNMKQAKKRKRRESRSASKEEPTEAASEADTESQPNRGAARSVPSEMIERLRQMTPQQREAVLERMPDELRDRVKESL